uniref:Uncharacterized protein n=1 Tax=Romanomermis culicivorax TaxID=13658 RepID=A0A915HWZ2_ROMCU
MLPLVQCRGGIGYRVLHTKCIESTALEKQPHSTYTSFARQLTKQADLSKGIPELPIPASLTYLSLYLLGSNVSTYPVWSTYSLGVNHWRLHIPDPSQQSTRIRDTHEAELPARAEAQRMPAQTSRQGFFG